MRESTRESTAEGECDSRPSGAAKFRAIYSAFHYKRSFAAGGALAQWDARFEFPVPTYFCRNRVKNGDLKPNSTSILVRYPRCTIGARSREAHSRSRRQEDL